MQKVTVSPFVSTKVVSTRFPNLTTPSCLDIAFVPQLLINLKVIRGTRTRKRVYLVQCNPQSIGAVHIGVHRCSDAQHGLQFAPRRGHRLP